MLKIHFLSFSDVAALSRFGSFSDVFDTAWPVAYGLCGLFSSLVLPHSAQKHLKVNHLDPLVVMHLDSAVCGYH